MEGSKTITLTIGVKNILSQMKEHSFYLGEALKSNPQLLELSAKIQASDDEDNVLYDFAKQGVTKLTNVINRVIGKASSEKSGESDETSYTITINTVQNFSNETGMPLQDLAVDYVSYYIISKWLNLVKPDESVRFENMLVQYEEDLKFIGSQRSKPTRS